jgi:hypothetical protein
MSKSKHGFLAFNHEKDCKLILSTNLHIGSSFFWKHWVFCLRQIVQTEANQIICMDSLLLFENPYKEEHNNTWTDNPSGKNQYKIVVLCPYLYLLRLDWNLILMSQHAEYEICEWQEPTCFESKYLAIKAITTTTRKLSYCDSKSL